MNLARNVNDLSEKYHGQGDIWELQDDVTVNDHDEFGRTS
jgi:hypothetical protein